MQDSEKYVKKVYSGRLNRRTYLVAGLVLGVIYGLISGLLSAIFGPQSSIAALISLVIVVFVVVVGLSFTVRRWHDLGKSGWYALLGLIPVINFFVWIYLIIWPGNDGKNMYGESPKDAFEFNKAFGLDK